ncbi:MAG: ornithine cyclodeaminase [Gammaproteobacteria bacterium]|nr:ornithine cyclodeaminase [Gammaproteobacteria bacterium]
MVRVIDVPTLQRFVAERGIEVVLSELTEAIEAAYVRWDDFDKSARHATHFDHGVIELMPVADATRYACKYVNGHPDNPKDGRMTVAALGILSDVASGYPLLVTEMTLLTALRTAATSAMVARHCARLDTHTLALIGTGAQSEFQTLALRNERPLRQIRFYDVDPAAMEKYAHNMAQQNLELVPCASIAEAVAGADLVTVATAIKDRQSLLTPAMLRPGMHINAVGGDCPGKTELDPVVLPACDIIVEYEPQTRIEGEIQGSTLPVTEFHEIARGTRDGRQTRDAITLFDSVGFALEDHAALNWLYANLRKATDVALIPDPEDPRNLFAMLQPPMPTYGRAANF